MSLLTTLGGGDVSYLYRDEFNTDRAAGAIDGTAIEPDGGINRLVLDDGSDMTIVDGWLRVGPGSAYGNPGYTWNQVIATTPGQQLLAKVRTIAKGNFLIGWDVGTTSTPNAAFFFGGSDLRIYNPSILNAEVGDYTIEQEYDLSLIQRTTGAHFFIRGGTEWPAWTLLWSSDYYTRTDQYARIVGGTSSQNRVKYLRVPEELWLPTPLVSDGFSSWGTSDGLGHAEGVAGGDALGQGGDGDSWTDQVGTWQAAAGVASCSALDTGVGIATAPAAAAVNIGATVTYSSGEVGLIVRYVDSDNYVTALHDGTNFVLRKVVGGTPTDVDTYVGVLGQIQLHAHGDYFRAYLGRVLRCEGTIADAALQSSSACGLYTTNTGNTFDDFLAWSRL